MFVPKETGLAAGMETSGEDDQDIFLWSFCEAHSQVALAGEVVACGT
jgi:hypothetical protein